MNPDPQHLALFGGTFDPVHEGHLALVETAREACRLDRVVFIPCARSPFKADSTLASAEDRYTMLSLALEERRWKDWASVSRFEIDRPPPSFSWQTADHFREAGNGSDELHWIVGADQWAQIDRWAEAERLREGLHFIVVTRQGSEVDPRPGWTATFLEFDHPASATAIREGRGLPEWLPDSVREYLESRNLYAPAPRDGLDS